MTEYWLFKPILLIKEYTGKQLPGRPVILGIELDVKKSNWGKEAEIISEVIRSRQSYVLVLTMNDLDHFSVNIDDIKDFVSLFVMGGSCEFRNGKPIIILNGLNKTDNIIQKISYSQQLQGFSEICFLDIYNRQADAILFSPDVINRMDEMAPAIGNYVYFRSDTIESALIMAVSTNKAIRQLLNKNQLCQQLAMRLNDTIEKFENLYSVYLAQSQKLAIADSFTELAKTKYKADYEELFNYYRNEYEVLPLWFKRLGHILKVITGKRTLRSLFSKNDKHKK